jgi:hypothetical protein
MHSVCQSLHVKQTEKYDSGTHHKAFYDVGQSAFPEPLICGPSKNFIAELAENKEIPHL